VRVRTALQQRTRDREVLLERQGRAVEHVRLEQGQAAAPDPILRDRDEWLDEPIELVGLAVIGVQRDLHRKRRSDDMRVLGQRRGTKCHVLRRARCEFATSGGDLQDAVGARIGEAAQRGDQR
jgi:hypothetical protein